MDVSVKTLHDEYEGHDVPAKEEEGECEDDEVGRTALKTLYEVIETQCCHGNGETWAEEVSCLVAFEGMLYGK